MDNVNAPTKKRDLSANVFSVLFKFRPRKDKSPSENFLTEALVYTLRRSPSAARAWISTLTNGRVKPKTFQFITRATCRDPERAVKLYPDISISGEEQSGNTYRLFVEHKWDAPYKEEQLSRYATLRKRGETLNLAFVCAKRRDLYQAQKFRKPNVQMNALQWEKVYELLGRIKQSNGTLNDFLAFLEECQLQPGEPIPIDNLKKRRKVGGSAKTRELLKRYSDKLANEYDWNEIPAPYRHHRTVSDRASFGRCAIVFYRKEGWAPAIALQFYYDKRDHKVPLVDPNNNIDLALRIHADPSKNPAPTKVLKLLKERVPRLKKLGATVRVKSDTENGNKHTLFIAQKSLTDVIDNVRGEAEQLEAIHAELSRWSKALFSNNPRLIASFKTLKPYY